MSHRVPVSVSTVAVLVALVSLGAAPSAAQTTPPRTAWGQPDLQGIWDFRTITPLQRPEELGDREFLTEEEAANLEQEVVDRNLRLLTRPAERTTASDQVDRREDGTPGFYNNFWLDRGTTVVGTRRASLIVDPPNGRLPSLTPEAERRAASPEAQRIADASRGRVPAVSWADLDPGDRCIQHGKAGPPINPGGYNNNVQLFQAPSYVAILNEQIHDVRVVPLDGRPHLGPQIQGSIRVSQRHFGAFSGFFVDDLMGKALWKLVENAQRFPRRGGRVLCVHGAVSFHRARPCATRWLPGRGAMRDVELDRDP